jgi:AraC family transcriptional regulator
MDERYGERLEKFVGVPQPATLSVSALYGAEFTATRVQWTGTPDGNLTRFDRDRGYMVCLQRQSLAEQPYWVDGRETRLAAMRSGQFLLLDLEAEHSSQVPGSVDCVSVYMSRAALDRFQEEHDLPLVGSLRAPHGAVHEDHVVRHLGESLLPALAQPEQAPQLFVDHVGLAFLSHLTGFYRDAPAPVAPARGGLAPWQQRRAKEMLLAHMDGRIGLEELAQACRLSRSHFARAFKVSTGKSPLQWLLAQRVERAKMLLAGQPWPIEMIANHCGFLDQSHFTRTFVRLVGVTPGQWRRIRRA